MVTIYVMCGIAGSGKSTVAKQLHIERNFNLHCFDNLSKGCQFEKRQKVYDEIYGCLRQDLYNKHNVIYDNLNITLERRLELLSALQNIPCKKILIVMTTPLEECVRRNSQRQGRARLPDFVIYHLNQRYQPPSLDEGWDDIQYV